MLGGVAMECVGNIIGVGFILFGIFVLFDPEFVWRYQESALRRRGIVYMERPDTFLMNHPRFIGGFSIATGVLFFYINSRG